MSKPIIKPVALAVCTAIGGLALSASAFAMSDLSAGYMLAAGEAGGEKAKEGSCGEGACGVDKMDADKSGGVSKAEFAAAHDGDDSKFAAVDTNGDGNVDQAEFDAAHKGKEGACGEGKCGGEKKGGEGACGDEKK